MGRLREGIARLARRLMARADPIILMYHRVAVAPIDPWGLAVDPEIFDQQMAVLARTRRPVPLDWLVGEIRAGRRPQRAVAVTFDDAYRDVLDNAKPSLDRHGIPATVFVVSGMVGSSRGYWWDELAELVFGAQAIPPRLVLPFGVFDAGSASRGGDREALHHELWQAIRVMPLADRYTAVTAIADAFGVPQAAPPPVMTEAELHALTRSGLVTLGVHTVTHASLPSLPTEEQRAEIRDCQAALERMTGAPNRRLAYPFGDFDDRSERLAEELGFDYAVSVNAGPAIHARQRFRLPRHDVKNWPEAEFCKRLQWFG